MKTLSSGRGAVAFRKLWDAETQAGGITVGPLGMCLRRDCIGHVSHVVEHRYDAGQSRFGLCRSDALLAVPAGATYTRALAMSRRTLHTCGSPVPVWPGEQWRLRPVTRGEAAEVRARLIELQDPTGLLARLDAALHSCGTEHNVDGVTMPIEEIAAWVADWLAAAPVDRPLKASRMATELSVRGRAPATDAVKTLLHVRSANPDGSERWAIHASRACPDYHADVSGPASDDPFAWQQTSSPLGYLVERLAGTALRNGRGCEVVVCPCLGA